MKLSLKAARVNKNMTQAQVAEKIGVTKDTVRRWETGKTSPRVNVVEKILSAYELSYDQVDWRK